jgi:hypothetical protein
MDVYSHLLPTMEEQASAAIEAALSFPYFGKDGSLLGPSWVLF